MSDDITHVQEFFTARAADWDSRFPDDGPAYAAAVAELGGRPSEATGRWCTAVRRA
ncbi:SAM-dependent methyltransferase, partial [Streptomyces sp. NPDC003703]